MLFYRYEFGHPNPAKDTKARVQEADENLVLFIEQIVDAGENCQLIIVGIVGSDVHHR
jgi:hypothetical protein